MVCPGYYDCSRFRTQRNNDINGDLKMPLPEANNYSQRIYELLKETDLENLSYSQFQAVAEKIFIEPENEDEMRRLVLVQLARMAVRGDWDGFLTGGGGGSIGGSISDNQIAVGATTDDTIEGSSNLTFDGSVLSVLNQLDIGGVGAAGIVKNSNTNQDLELRVLGTGNVRVKNETTNTDSQLNVQGNGTGTPKVSLSNDTKAVTLQCDTNQKLTVKGGTEEFVLDVSSATGGITFPDGTTQTTAATGGSGGINPLSFTTSQGLAVTAYWLLGLNPTVATAMENENLTTGVNGFVVKFQPPFTGTTGITMGINVAAAADSNYLWIYEESATGWAGSFVAKIKMPTTSTGLQSETQWLDAAGSNITSPTFTQGDTYVAVLEIASNFTCATGRQANLPFVILANAAAFTNPTAEFYNYQYTGTIDASLPDSDINFFTSTVGWPFIGLEL